MIPEWEALEKLGGCVPPGVDSDTETSLFRQKRRFDAILPKMVCNLSPIDLKIVTAANEIRRATSPYSIAGLPDSSKRKN
jgi:hypothetical protein